MISKSCSFDTRRLTVKEWRALVARREDMVEAVVNVLSPAVTHFLPDGWQGEYTAERASMWLAERDGEGATLLVVENASQTPIGFMFLFESEAIETGRCIRIGFLLAESSWGQGIASELLKGLVEWCRTVEIASVIGGVDHENIASQRVLENSGFVVLPSIQGQEELVYEYRLR